MSALHNIKTLCKARNIFNKFFDDYSSMVSETRHTSIHGEGLETLTCKQML